VNAESVFACRDRNVGCSCNLPLGIHILGRNGILEPHKIVRLKLSCEPFRGIDRVVPVNVEREVDDERGVLDHLGSLVGSQIFPESCATLTRTRPARPDERLEVACLVLTQDSRHLGPGPLAREPLDDVRERLSGSVMSPETLVASSSEMVFVAIPVRSCVCIEITPAAIVHTL
jgi:hypothetical protein